MSDRTSNFTASFLRCSPDHHNLLIFHAPVPYLNHYALEHDDIDAVLRAGSIYLRNHGEEVQVAGPGRHFYGSNVFWYLVDPAGNYFEYFADMDQIVDDDAWQPDVEVEKNTTSWTAWGNNLNRPEMFFRPKDLEELKRHWADSGGSVDTRAAYS